jgi:hypothetical protein
MVQRTKAATEEWLKKSFFHRPYLFMKINGVEEERYAVGLLLEFPLPIVQRTDIPGFEPSRNAVEMEGMLSRY